MANLKNIRSRIKGVKSTQQTTKAMKMVAAAKLKKAQDNILNLRPYALKLQDLLNNLGAGLEEGAVASPYMAQRPAGKVLYVIVTSNRGLAGAFNNAIIRLAEEHVRRHYPTQCEAGNVRVLAIGRKAYDFYRKRKGGVVADKNHDVFVGLSFEKVARVAEFVMEGYLNGDWDRVEIAYNEFKNVATQIRRVETFLPASQGQSQVNTAKPDYIFEPDAATLIESLVPQILKLKFFKAVLESNASEHGARMIAMDNATENAQELLASLKLEYNKARQAAITKEILEIVSGANALGG